MCTLNILLHTDFKGHCLCITLTVQIVQINYIYKWQVHYTYVVHCLYISCVCCMYSHLIFVRHQFVPCALDTGATEVATELLQ